MKKIILAPFSIESILLYEKISLVLPSPVFIFDQNLNYNGKCYKKTRIVNPFYLHDACIIISSKIHGKEIKNDYKNLGYKESDFITVNEINQELCDNYSAAANIDFDMLEDLYIEHAGTNLKKLRKMKRISEIKAFEYMDEKDIFGVGEYGYERKEVAADRLGTRHIFLKRLELDVTSKCSLHCKYCSNMMQYYERPYDLDAEQILMDLSRMLELVEWIDEILLIGGEPFMYRKLAELLTEISKNEEVKRKVGQMELVTNGTIVPDDTTMGALKEAKVFVMISNYGDKSRNLDKLVNKLCEFSIRYAVMSLPYWANVEQYVDAKEIMTEKDRMRWRKEMCSTLHRVVDSGKFYLCCHLKSLDQLSAISAEAKGCFVDIYDENVIDKMEKYLSDNEPLPKACSWCNGNALEQWQYNMIPVAEQTSEIMPYTKY